MNRISLCLLAATAVASANVAMVAGASAQMQAGNWIVRTNPPQIQADCVLVNTADDNDRNLLAYHLSNGVLQLTVFAKNVPFDNIDSHRQGTIRFDDRSYDDLEIFSGDAFDTVNLTRFDAARNRLSSEADFAKASKLEVQTKVLSATFDISGAAIALEGLRQCENAANPMRMAQVPPVAGIGMTPPLPPTSDEASRLGQALGGVNGTSPTFAQYLCSADDSQLYGIATMRGGVPGPMTLGIAEDGTGEINGNGLRLQPVYSDSGNGNGELSSVAYRVTDILQALGVQPETAAPPLANMSAEEMAGYRAFLGLAQGMAQQAMAGRQRYLTVSLADDTLRFLDLTASNQAVNIATLDCTRTQ